jgi:hypothetical protein
MKLSSLYVTLLSLLVVTTAVNGTITDWTTVQDSARQTTACVDQIKNQKILWTGDCEGSYAAMTASVIQDQICVAFSFNADSDLKNLSKMRVSYQDIICNCEICHQFSSKGCSGGKVQETLKFIQTEGFIGGAENGNTSSGITFSKAAEEVFKPEFKWVYNSCMSFFKPYCELEGSKACTESNNPMFDKTKNCAKIKTGSTDKFCSNDDTKKIKEVRQKGLVTYS